MNEKTVWISVTCSLMLVTASPVSDVRLSMPQVQVPVSTTHPIPPPTLPPQEPLLPQGSSMADVAVVENEFVDYFGDDTWRMKRRTRWSVVHVLDSMAEPFVRQICQEAYTTNLRSVFAQGVANPNEIWTYDVFSAELAIGRKSKKVWISVLECASNAPKRETFYLTKGRRENSAYFVKPTSRRVGSRPPGEFVLDGRFETDVDFKTDFFGISRTLFRAWARRSRFRDSDLADLRLNKEL